MTQEERNAIRARCEVFHKSGFGINGEKIIVGLHAAMDIPVLLNTLSEALDESESNNKYLGFTAKEWHEENVKLKEGLEKVLADCMVERDHWKARAEALERAIYQNCNYCVLYLRDKLADDCWERRRNTGVIDFGCEGWQFDEARFAKPKDGSVE